MRNNTYWVDLYTPWGSLHWSGASAKELSTVVASNSSLISQTRLPMRQDMGVLNTVTGESYPMLSQDNEGCRDVVLDTLLDGLSRD